MDPVPAFALEIVVEPQHIDELGHVNNVVYCGWAQDVGVTHWRTRASPEMLARWIWVASRLEIDFVRESHVGERLRVETWLGEPRGARFDRHVRIVGPDGSVRARVVTTWALLDAASRRPARVPPEVIAAFGA